MGAAAYHRGSNAIAAQIDRDCPPRPTAFLIMDRINALPKYPQADPTARLLETKSVPCGGKVVIEADRHRPDHWWVMCPDKLYAGTAFCYASLEAAVRSWDIYLTGYDATLDRWTAEAIG